MKAEMRIAKIAALVDLASWRLHLLREPPGYQKTMHPASSEVKEAAKIRFCLWVIFVVVPFLWLIG